jgi:hypothetical protein
MTDARAWPKPQLFYFILLNQNFILLPAGPCDPLLSAAGRPPLLS